MLKKPKLKKKELTEFVMKRVKECEPTISFEQGVDDLTFRLIEPNGAASGWLQLHHVWHAYQRSGDLNTIIDFINGQIEAMQYFKQMLQQPRGVDMSNVYPTIRPANYIRDHQENLGKCFSDNSVPGLDTIFVERKEGFTVVINESLVEPILSYMNEEEIKKQAYDNLSKRGWVAPQKALLQ